jgi:urease alpha subunit
LLGEDKITFSLLFSHSQIPLAMAEYDLLVLNGLVVTDSHTEELDIAVKDGRIVKVVPKGALSADKAKKTIDAQGGMVMVSRIISSIQTLSLNIRFVARWG